MRPRTPCAPRTRGPFIAGPCQPGPREAARPGVAAVAGREAPRASTRTCARTRTDARTFGRSSPGAGGPSHARVQRRESPARRHPRGGAEAGRSNRRSAACRGCSYRARIRPGLGCRRAARAPRLQPPAGLRSVGPGPISARVRAGCSRAGREMTTAGAIAAGIGRRGPGPMGLAGRARYTGRAGHTGRAQDAGRAVTCRPRGSTCRRHAGQTPRPAGRAGPAGPARPRGTPAPATVTLRKAECDNPKLQGCSTPPWNTCARPSARHTVTRRPCRPALRSRPPHAPAPLHATRPHSRRPHCRPLPPHPAHGRSTHAPSYALLLY
jgi:hypothetical protein